MLRVTESKHLSGKITRRTFLKHAATLALVRRIVPPGLIGGVNVLAAASRKKSDIQIEHISFGYDEYLYRAPVGFAGAVMNRATMITVRCSVRSAAGIVASGFASMPFNHTFSFPSKTLSDETKNDAMKALAAELAKVTGGYRNLLTRSTSTGT